MSAPADSVLPEWTSRLIAELNAADRRAESVAQGLSKSQLNWQPGPGVWSVGQCLEHLRVSNEVMIPALSAALEGGPHGRVREIRLGWFVGRFIRAYIAPNPGGTRAKAPKKIDPPSQIDPSVLEGLLRSNQAARELASRASQYDVNRIRYKNPFIPFLRFTVGAGLEIISQHQGRHLLQAEGVRHAPGFPR